MDFLQKEIARKRQEVDCRLKATSAEKPRTFFKRGELEVKVKRPVQEEPVEKTEEPVGKRDKLDNAAEETQREAEKSAHDTDEPTSKSQERQSVSEGLPLSRFEVTTRLRERRLPIRLYGESDAGAFDRLRRAEMSELSDMQPGFKNDFKAALDKLDEDLLAEMIREHEERARGGSASNSSKFDVRISKNVDLDVEKWIKEISRGDTHRDADIVLRYLKDILNKWGEQLNARSMDEKVAYSGRLESARHATTCEYIRPLFKQLRSHSRVKDSSSRSEQTPIDADMLDSLAKIVASCLRRDYLAAGDAYVELAIGNACWPLGVTNHGIHARTAQEKIHAKNVAHVLNDETQRKFIQAAKRLITLAETFYPPGSTPNSTSSRSATAWKC